jgi:hypothetical protein
MGERETLFAGGFPFVGTSNKMLVVLIALWLE